MSNNALLNDVVMVLFVGIAVAMLYNIYRI